MQHRRAKAASMFQNGISRNTKCDIMVGFHKSSHILAIFPLTLENVFSAKLFYATWLSSFPSIGSSLKCWPNSSAAPVDIFCSTTAYKLKLAQKLHHFLDCYHIPIKQDLKVILHQVKLFRWFPVFRIR